MHALDARLWHKTTRKELATIHRLTVNFELLLFNFFVLIWVRQASNKMENTERWFLLNNVCDLPLMEFQCSRVLFVCMSWVKIISDEAVWKSWDNRPDINELRRHSSNTDSVLTITAAWVKWNIKINTSAWVPLISVKIPQPCQALIIQDRLRIARAGD